MSAFLQAVEIGAGIAVGGVAMYIWLLGLYKAGELVHARINREAGQ